MSLSKWFTRRKVEREVRLDRCANNCGRYINFEAGKDVCCSQCNGFNTKHSAKCEHGNETFDISIVVTIKADQLKIHLHVCRILGMRLRLFTHLRDLLVAEKITGTCRTYVGNEEKRSLKVGDTLDGTNIYIRGEIIGVVRRVTEFMTGFVHENGIADVTTFRYASLADKNHYVVMLVPQDLKTQLYILHLLEDAEVSYKVEIYGKNVPEVPETGLGEEET